MPLFYQQPHPTLKICGVTTPHDAEALVELGVPALGINFWPHSKRHLPPAQARHLLQPLAGHITRVGVFVNAPLTDIRRLWDDGLLDVVQLHGDEPPATIATLRQANIPVIRALSIDAPLSTHLAELPDALLLDAPAGAAYGGTGQTFSWEKVRPLRKLHPHLPLILAGGITPKNAAQALHLAQPQALDVASGAETTPGHKDLQKVRQLLALTQAPHS